jgi:hypothetical protein
MKVINITNKICLVNTTDSVSLGSVFLRFQEYYESPEWRGKIFTIGQFRAWYSEKYGHNSYEKDWSGFNIPSYVLKPFIQGLFDPLTPLEQQFLELFRYRTDDFYIIGASSEDTSTLDHEICHGLYYTCEPYRKAVQSTLKTNSKHLKPVYEFVSGMMYDKSVWDDEVHAYICANPDFLTNENISFPKAAHKQLLNIKNKYFKSSL